MSDVFVCDFNVLRVKTFDRKSGSVGQEVVIANDRGYPVSLSAVDKDICDFSNLSGITRLHCEPVFDFDKVISSSGQQYNHNYVTLKVIGCDIVL